MMPTERITYDEPLLQGWRKRAESMDMEANHKIKTLIDEIYLLRADLVKMMADWENNQPRSELAQFHEALDYLVQIVDASMYGEDSLHHHTCVHPHGKCSCGAHSAVDQARKVLKEKPSV